MPYNEFETQARLYLEIAKQKLDEGNKGEAENQFNIAKNIARKENLADLVNIIDEYLDELK